MRHHEQCRKCHSRIQKYFEVVAVMRHYESKGLLRTKFITWQNDWTITFNNFANGLKPRESTKETVGEKTRRRRVFFRTSGCSTFFTTEQSRSIFICFMIKNPIIFPPIWLNFQIKTFSKASVLL